MAFHVAQRRHEMGLRIALGADRGRVLRAVLGRALRFAAIGIAIGVIGVVTTTRITASLLYAVEPLNVPLLLGVILFLAVVAIAASAVPARRAVRIDPIEAMRLE